MPMMNLSVALTNPYTLDKFNVVRQTEVVDNTGFSEITEQTFSGVQGVVYAAQMSTTDLLMNMSKTPKAIEIITTFGLIGESDITSGGDTSTMQPDIIVWHGNNYKVMSVEDYSAYGPGFINAMAVLFDAVANAPTTNPTLDTTDGMFDA
jgi:hypothetical protein